MKKIYVLGALSTLSLLSCSNDEEFSLKYVAGELKMKSIVEEQGFEVIDLNGEPCIRFDSDTVFNAVLEEMSGMSESGQITMFSKYGFTSQLELMRMAMIEQEQIVDSYESNLNRPYPSRQIKKFKEKYRDVSHFNPYDRTDFIPEYKIDIIYRSYTNRKGIFMIGDSIVMPSERTLEFLYGSPIMLLGDNITTDENSVNKAETKYQIPRGNYVKVRAIHSFKRVVVIKKERCMDFGFELLSQKKKVFWKNHHADIYMTFNIMTSGFDENNQRIIYTAIDGLFHDISDKVWRHIGFIPINNNLQGYFYWAAGTMSIWSSEIPHKGYGKIDLSTKK